MAESRSLRIDIVSDVVCPWCFVGKRRLEEALTSLARTDPGITAAVRWHAFELNPDLPSAGVDRRDYLDRKFGGPERAAAIYERLTGVGASVGIDFHFERIVRQPNTRDAHRLIDWAQARGDASELVERLFVAYFCDGGSLVETAVLAAIAGAAGLDADAARAHLDSDAGAAAVVEAERRAHAIGVTGVPFFIFDGKVAVSGAQTADVLLQAIAQAQHEIAPAG